MKPTYESVPQAVQRKAKDRNDLERLRWKLREKAQKSLYFFSKGVLGYPDITPKFHKGLCEWLSAAPFKGGRYLIEIFRGGLKTTLCTVCWNLHEMVQYSVRTDGVVVPAKGRFGPLVRIILVGGSASNISKFLVHRIQPKFYPSHKNRMFHWLFPEIIPTNFRDEIWNNYSLTIPRPYDPEGPTIEVLGAGTGSKPEGKRANRIIEDDVFGLESWRRSGTAGGSTISMGGSVRMKRSHGPITRQSSSVPATPTARRATTRSQRGRSDTVGRRSNG
jgi:hypothetical protein